jgi:serine/threonine protein kinase
LALTPGTRLGSYEIQAQIGEGGMGRVYRARDTRLNRDVAIKVLPEELAQNPDRVARFEREATILASLNHPHIAHVYGIEEADGVSALVMEYVKGEPLGPQRRPMDGALTIARQLTEALHAAHEKGIVHRDLKPANVMITPDGHVKVLDFGLAKLGIDHGDETAGVAKTDSPTMPTLGRTREGMLLGTAAYMSPEQARGQAVDARTDIWAFGCVLYEMLTGRAAFARDTLSDTIAAVIEREPDWRQLPESLPGNLRRLLRRCLEKDLNRRLADIRDARLELDEGPADASVNGRSGTRGRRMERLAWAAALLACMTAAGLVIVSPSRRAPSSAVHQTRFVIWPPPTRDSASLAISPDGRQIVFAATADDRTKLWIHSLDTGSARPLPGTDGGQLPFWSPDGRAIGFFAQGKLKKIDIDSGTVTPLANAPNPQGGGDWSKDGTIVFVPVGGSPVLQIKEDGGEVTPILSTAGPGVPPGAPKLLEGTRRVLFSKGDGLYAGDLDGKDSRRLADSALVIGGEESLLFIRGSTLFVQRFDPRTLVLSGTPTQVATDVTAASLAGDGTLVYRSGHASVSQLTWFDRAGTEVARERGGGGRVPSISHDGHRVAMMRERSLGDSKPGVWIWDLSRDVYTRPVPAPPVGNTPIFSYDDTEIIYSSPRNNQPFALYARPADGSGSERLVLQTVQGVFANDWWHDVLIYRSSDPKGGYDLWTLKGTHSEPLVRTQSNEREAQFSPDGRWFAYQSDETGQYEIYIDPYPVDDGRKRHVPVSVHGGTQVRWNGKELFYLSPDDRLMSVHVDISADGREVATKPAVPLFQTHIAEAGVTGQQYVVSHDGNQFLIATMPESKDESITVIQNWKPGR